jgi:hypothetical protein
LVGLNLVLSSHNGNCTQEMEMTNIVWKIAKDLLHAQSCKKVEPYFLHPPASLAGTIENPVRGKILRDDMNIRIFT